MVTILGSGGFRFVIYLNDHTPAHVHAIKGNGEAKINVAGATAELDWADGLKRSEVRQALEIAEQNLAMFLQEWERIHG